MQFLFMNALDDRLVMRKFVESASIPYLVSTKPMVNAKQGYIFPDFIQCVYCILFLNSFFILVFIIAKRSGILMVSYY